VNTSPGRARGADAAELLRGAFQAWPGAAGWRWTALVYPVPPILRTGAPTVVRVDLTAQDALALAALVDAANKDLSPAPGVPFSPWLDLAEAAAFAGVQPATLRSWLARGGPKHHPFPQPGHRSQGSSYWQERTLRAWKTGYRPTRGANAPRDTPFRRPLPSLRDHDER